MSTRNSYIPVSLHKMDTHCDVLLLKSLSHPSKNKHVSSACIKIALKNVILLKNVLLYVKAKYSAKIPAMTWNISKASTSPTYYHTLQDESVVFQQCNLTIPHVGNDRWKFHYKRLSIKVQLVSNFMNGHCKEHDNKTKTYTHHCAIHTFTLSSK